MHAKLLLLFVKPFMKAVNSEDGWVRWGMRLALTSYLVLSVGCVLLGLWQVIATIFLMLAVLWLCVVDMRKPEGN